MLGDPRVMFFAPETQQQRIRSQIVDARFHHIHRVIVLRGEEDTSALPREVDEQRGDHLRFSGSRRSGHHGDGRREALHYGLALLGIEWEYFEDGPVLGRRGLDVFAAQPQAERGVLDGRALQLAQFPQFDFESVGEGGAGAGEEHGAIVNPRLGEFGKRRLLREEVGIELLLPSPVGAAARQTEHDLVPRRQIVFRIRQAQFFGELNSFVDQVAAIGGQHALQHFEVEQRDGGRGTQCFERLVERVADRIQQHRLETNLLPRACLDGSHTQGITHVESELRTLAPHSLEQSLDLPLCDRKRATGKRKFVQRNIVGRVGDRNANAGAAFLRKALEVVAAEVIQEGSSAGRRIGGCGPVGPGPPAIGVILDHRGPQQRVERCHDFGTLEPQFVGNLLRLESGLVGEQLLDAIRLAHAVTDLRVLERSFRCA